MRTSFTSSGKARVAATPNTTPTATPSRGLKTATLVRPRRRNENSETARTRMAAPWLDVVALARAGILTSLS